MRMRTEEKRQEFIRTAAQLFKELGYERTSMPAIAARLGGSNAMLYGYFSSKEDRLRAALDHDVNEEADRLMRWPWSRSAALLTRSGCRRAPPGG